MTREQKIKVLQLVEQGNPIKKAIELAEMPEVMFVIGQEEAARVKATGYIGDLIIIEIVGGNQHCDFPSMEEDVIL